MDQIVQKFRKAVIFYHVYKSLLYFFPPKSPVISVPLSPIGPNPDNTNKSLFWLKQSLLKSTKSLALSPEVALLQN